MQITIEDIPNGRKIKHISVDISFEETSEDTTGSVKIKSSATQQAIHLQTAPVTAPVTAPTTAPEPIMPENTTSINAEIPKEMQDIEF